MPTIVLAATLTSVRSSRIIISASASARIRREAMRANVLKDIGLVTTLERVKVMIFRFLRIQKNNCTKK